MRDFFFYPFSLDTYYLGSSVWADRKSLRSLIESSRNPSSQCHILFFCLHVLYEKSNIKHALLIFNFNKLNRSSRKVLFFR